MQDKFNQYGGFFISGKKLHDKQEIYFLFVVFILFKCNRKKLAAKQNVFFKSVCIEISIF